MKVVLAAIISYLLGSINSSILVGRLWANVDIRNYGSGNAGATNTLRTLGKSAAVVVLLGDVLKGVIGVIIGKYIAGDLGMLAAGVACVLGHNFPVYFGFKGGKGILTSAAVVFMVNWKIGLILLLLVIAIIAITRYVSLGSIIGAGLYPVVVFLMDNRGSEFIIFAFCIAVLAVYRHKENIKRLFEGTESKIGSKVKV
ncbi:glycerol-3-phosphate 1-O-acyltransferase PlsY [Petroclostridium sp. X23]|uniref:glycerol-3-phosphate 1-O-acyltransferase PlsY n=1 Tax=Petroclostridium sp. X23 TaxID=3045146 RepID=UPI0024ACCABD|nr:glycerol-3-phosphate 1-O-acyltransferase PlsY [Petroclostridium sp. X23]WHH59866.1 glycerol-3-phosphate 1-O-acyltransferase PlsY [Petroclostridium sp. X23]